MISDKIVQYLQAKDQTIQVRVPAFVKDALMKNAQTKGLTLSQYLNIVLIQIIQGRIE